MTEIFPFNYYFKMFSAIDSIFFSNIYRTIYFMGPEIFLMLFLLFILIFSTKWNKLNLKDIPEKTILLNKYLIITLNILVVHYIVLWLSLGTTKVKVLHNYLYIIDTYTIFFKILIAITSAVILLFSFKFIRQSNAKNLLEFPVIFGCAVLSMLLFVSSFDLISMYLTLEALSLALYTLAASDYSSEASIESGVKYFAIGAVSSGILIYGISLLYGVFSATDFLHIFSFIYKENYLPYFLLLHWGFLGVLVGFFFKISAFPCHFWTPDVYEGCPLPITAFFAITVKLAVIAFLLRFTSYTISYMFFNLQYIFYFVSISSMFIGCFCAFLTERLKRFIAYSTINHIGYILVGLTINSFAGLKAAIIYLVFYAVINTLFFYCIIYINSTQPYTNSIVYWSDFTQFIKHDKNKMVLISFLILSLSGIPPLVGFATKYLIILAAIEANFFFLTYIMLFISTISSFYYLRILKILWNDLTKDNLLKYVFFVNDSYYWISVFIFSITHVLVYLYTDVILDIFDELTYHCKYISVGTFFLGR